jgi:hypothetical protein
VLTDTLQGIGRVFADALRCRLTFFTEEWGIYPLVPRASVAVSDSARHGDCLGTSGDENLWTRELAVSACSQSVYPNGNEAWCSLVSLSMVITCWADRTGREDIDLPVSAVVQGTYNRIYGETATGRLTQRTPPLWVSTLRSDGRLAWAGRAVSCGRSTGRREYRVEEGRALRRADTRMRRAPVGDPGLRSLRGRHRQLPGRPRRLAGQARLPPPRVRPGLVMLRFRRGRLPRLPGGLRVGPCSRRRPG